MAKPLCLCLDTACASQDLPPHQLVVDVGWGGSNGSPQAAAVREVCYSCGAKRIGRAALCVKCEQPWQGKAAKDDVQLGRPVKPQPAQPAHGRRDFRVRNPDAVSVPSMCTGDDAVIEQREDKIVSKAGEKSRVTQPSPAHDALPAGEREVVEEGGSEEIPLLVDESVQPLPNTMFVVEGLQTDGVGCLPPRTSPPPPLIPDPGSTQPVSPLGDSEKSRRGNKGGRVTKGTSAGVKSDTWREILARKEAGGLAQQLPPPLTQHAPSPSSGLATPSAPTLQAATLKQWQPATVQQGSAGVVAEHVQEEQFGIGMILRLVPGPDSPSGHLVVKSLVEGSPAARSGQICVGDIVRSVNGAPVATAEEAVGHFLGQRGSEIELLLVRSSQGPSPLASGSPRTVHVTLVRDVNRTADAGIPTPASPQMQRLPVSPSVRSSPGEGAADKDSGTFLWGHTQQTQAACSHPLDTNNVAAVDAVSDKQGRCGAASSRPGQCRRCQATIKPGAQFCTNCGLEARGPAVLTVEQLVAIGVTDPDEQANLLGFQPSSPSRAHKPQAAGTHCNNMTTHSNQSSANDTQDSPARRARDAVALAGQGNAGGPSQHAAHGGRASESLAPWTEVAAAKQHQPALCALCKAAPSVLCCSKCKSVDYCSVSCQQKHWLTGHRRECDSLIDQRDRGQLEAGLQRLLMSASDESALRARVGMNEKLMEEDGDWSFHVIHPSDIDELVQIFRLVAIGVSAKQEQAELLGYDPRDRLVSNRRSRRVVNSEGPQPNSTATPPASTPPRERATPAHEHALGTPEVAGASGSGGDVSGQQAYVGAASVDMSTPFACGSFKNAYVGTMNGRKICVLRHRGGEAAANAEVRHEVKILKRIGAHANIVKCVGIFRYSSPGMPEVQQCLVLEFCEHGLLSDWLARRQQGAGLTPELLRRHIALQICDAMEAVSGAGVVHRDLAAHNVLVFSEQVPLPWLAHVILPACCLRLGSCRRS